MKRFLSVFLALAMIACVVAGFAGCSKSGKDDEVVPYSSSKGIRLLKQLQTLIKLRMLIKSLLALQIMSLSIIRLKEATSGSALMQTL